VLHAIIPFQIFAENHLCSQQKSNHTTYYKTPTEEFEIHRIQLPRHQTITHQSIDAPHILITLSGNGKLESDTNNSYMKKRTILFIGANCSYSIKADSDLDAIRGTVPFEEV